MTQNNQGGDGRRREKIGSQGAAGNGGPGCYSMYDMGFEKGNEMIKFMSFKDYHGLCFENLWNRNKSRRRKPLRRRL